MALSLSHKLIALLLAVLMPLCCCQLHIFEMVAAAADGAAPDAITSCDKQCCSQRHLATDSDEPAEDENHDCCPGLCCAKFAGAAGDWVPPVDRVGLDLPSWSLPSAEIVIGSQMAAHALPARDGPHQPPPPLTTLVKLHCALLL